MKFYSYSMIKAGANLQLQFSKISFPVMNPNIFSMVRVFTDTRSSHGR